MTADVNLVIFFQVVLPKGRPPGWEEGPLPLRVLLRDEDATLQNPQYVNADSTWRSKHLLAPAAKVLSGQHRGTTRLHRKFPDETEVPAGDHAQVRLEALELLIVGERSLSQASDPRRRLGVLAAHLRVVEPGWIAEPDGSDHADRPTTQRILGALKPLCRDLLDPESQELRWRLPAELTNFIGPFIEPAEGYDNAYVAFLLTPRAGEKSSPSPIPKSLDLWNLAMVSPSRRPGPHVEKDAGISVQLPNGQALVTRFGLVHRVTTRGDFKDPRTTNGQQHYLFRTIYLDALLMAMLQRRLVDRLANSSLRLVDPVRSPVGFNRLSRDFRWFSVTWWRRRVSRWEHPDRVMRAVQEVLELDSRYAELREDHEFFAGMLRAAQTLRLNTLIVALTLLGLISVAADLVLVAGISDRIAQTVLLASVPTLALVLWITVSIARRIATWFRRA